MDPMGVPLVPGFDGKLINENLMQSDWWRQGRIRKKKDLIRTESIYGYVNEDGSCWLLSKFSC